MDDLKWLIFVLVILAIAWFAAGGYQREVAREGPLLDPPDTIGERGRGFGGSFFGLTLNNARSGSSIRAPDGTPSGGTVVNTGGRTSGSSRTGSADRAGNSTSRNVQNFRESVEEQQKNIESSIHKDEINISRVTSGKATDPNKEYITISASSRNKKSINITGWKLKSAVTGKKYEIPDGTYTFKSGNLEDNRSIILEPGEKAIITTGRSPIGVSFKENICSGYLTQFQRYTPTLRSSCPLPENYDIPFDPHSFDDACLDYIDKLSRCRIKTDPIPREVKPACRQFINRHFNYNGCVDDFRNSDDFYSNQWRIYLGRSEEVWKPKRELIQLLDNNGNLVDAEGY